MLQMLKQKWLVRLVVLAVLFVTTKSDMASKTERPDVIYTIAGLKKFPGYKFIQYSEYGVSNTPMVDSARIFLPGGGREPATSAFFAIDTATKASTDTIWISNKETNMIVNVVAIRNDSLIVSTKPAAKITVSKVFSGENTALFLAENVWLIIGSLLAIVGLVALYIKRRKKAAQNRR